MSDFNDLPVDPDTKILSQAEVEINGYQAILQKWRWDGITAHSLILKSVEVSHLNDEQLKSMISSSNFDGRLDSKTVSRKGTYTFINFNFKY